MIRPFFSPQYYAQRGTFLLDVSERKTNHVSEVRVTFAPPEHGWIDMSIYLDGLKACEITWSDVYDPSEDIRDWLTDIITGDQKLTQLFINQESSEAILTFEEFGVEMAGDICTAGIKASRGLQMVDGKNKKEVEEFNNRVQLGLFTVYEPWDNTMPVKAIVNTRQLVGAIYLGLLSYAATFTSENVYECFTNNWDFNRVNGDELESLFCDEDVDEDSMEYQFWGKWMFYNNIKSAKLEWYLFEDCPWNKYRPDFSIPSQRIDDYVLMSTELGNGLFWQWREVCCGDVEKLKLNDLEIDLSDIKGLREWYEEYQAKKDGEKWDSKKQREWQRRGRGFAFEIRKRLPANIDLYFNWLSFKHDNDELPNVMSLIPNLPIWTFVPLEWR